MKGEQQEERIPNFIGNAVIILTASPSGLRGGDARHRTGGVADETPARGGTAGHVRKGRMRCRVGCPEERSGGTG